MATAARLKIASDSLGVDVVHPINVRQGLQEACGKANRNGYRGGFLSLALGSVIVLYTDYLIEYDAQSLCSYAYF